MQGLNFIRLNIVNLCKEDSCERLLGEQVAGSYARNLKGSNQCKKFCVLRSS